MRPARRVVVAVLLACSLIVSLGSSSAAADTPVHEVHHRDGPWEVEVDTVTYGSGQTGVIYRPAGAAGEAFPVLVWGNGSGATPEANYADLLRAVASHGFVITATDHREVGTGEPLLESLEHLRSVVDDPGSVLHGRVDMNRVGIFGHSQGAGGSTKAASASDVFDAVVLLALPARPFAFEAEKKFDTANVSAPTLLLAGTLDVPISPTPINQDHFARLAGPAAMAMITGADHLVFANDGGIGRGYIIAWFDYLLRGDAEAASAFVGSDPEVFRHPAFESQDAKGLAPPSPGVGSSSDSPADGAPAAPGGDVGAVDLPMTGGASLSGVLILGALLLLVVRWLGRARPARATGR